MCNIKNMVLVFIAITSFSTRGMDSIGELDLFSGCLISFTCTGDFAKVDTFAYKIGSDKSICFAILVKKNPIKLSQEFGIRKYLYKLCLLSKAKLAHHLPSTFADSYSANGPSEIRKVTDGERILIQKAIKYNGARFWGYPTDGDSLQLWESSK